MIYVWWYIDAKIPKDNAFTKKHLQTKLITYQRRLKITSTHKSILFRFVVESQHLFGVFLAQHSSDFNRIHNLYFPFSEFPNCSGKATNVCLVHFSPWVETLSMDYYFMWVFLNFYLLSFWDSSGWFDLVMALIIWLLFLLFPRYFLYLFCHLQSSGCSL